MQVKAPPIKKKGVSIWDKLVPYKEEISPKIMICNNLPNDIMYILNELNFKIQISPIVKTKKKWWQIWKR
jgi:hypothetical protein